MRKGKIAIPVNKERILDAHFGHCQYFNVFQIEAGEIVSDELLNPPHHEPGVLPKWLVGLGVTDVIVGGMGQKAIQILQHNNVNVFTGSPKESASNLVKGWMNETIDFSPNDCSHDRNHKGEHKCHHD